MTNRILFDAQFMRQLERLRILSRKIPTGIGKGENRSTRAGSSVEFKDFREYLQGDDTRFVDWNMYARTENLFLKIFVDDVDVLVNVIVDASASMQSGDPPKNDYARRLAMALGHLALSQGERLRIYSVGEKVNACTPIMRGRAATFKAMRFLENVVSAGRTDFDRSVKELSVISRQPGITFIVSDLIAPTGIEQALHYLRYRKHDVRLLQVLAPEEIDPPLGGDWRLRDIETDEDVEITMSQEAVREYRRAFGVYRDKINVIARTAGLPFVTVSTREKFEDVIFRRMRAAGAYSA